MSRIMFHKMHSRMNYVLLVFVFDVFSPDAEYVTFLCFLFYIFVDGEMLAILK